MIKNITGDDLMGRKKMPQNQSEHKKAEFNQIEEWVNELPEFSEDESELLSYEDIIQLVDKSKNDSEHTENIIIIGKISEVLSREVDSDHINTLFAFLGDFDSDSLDYSMLGMSSYEAKNFVVAERAYRIAVEQCDEEYLIIGYKNNLAYLIRRKEIENPEKRNEKEVPILLRDGTAKKDTFSLINMALFWALEHGSKENWDLADKLVSYANRDDVTGAFEWWKNVALAGEAEGYFVHLLLIRRGKVAGSSLGNMEDLFKHVKKEYPGIPEKMKEIVTPFDGELTELLPWLDDGDIKW